MVQTNGARALHFGPLTYGFRHDGEANRSDYSAGAHFKTNDVMLRDDMSEAEKSAAIFANARWAVAREIAAQFRSDLDVRLALHRNAPDEVARSTNDRYCDSSDDDAPSIPRTRYKQIRTWFIANRNDLYFESQRGRFISAHTLRGYCNRLDPNIKLKEVEFRKYMSQASSKSSPMFE